MIHNSHSISCVDLSKSLLNEIMSEAGHSHTACLVSSLGSIFILGDTEDFEVIEVDENHEQYVVTDAGGVLRTILFHGEWSDYGVLISNNGVATSTTGLVAGPDDDESFKQFVKYETGELGQECKSCSEVVAGDDPDEELH